MANEASYAGFAGMIANIYEAAYLTARDAAIVSNLVHPWTGTGLMPRIFGTYAGGTAQTLTEASDGAAQTWAGTASGTVTPSIIYASYFMNDTLAASDPNTMVSDASRDLGNIIGQKLDADLCGLFASFSGSIGSVGGTLTWNNINYAAMKMRAAYAPMPYMCVLNPMHWYQLVIPTAANVPNVNTSQAWLNAAVGSPLFVGNYGGIFFFLDGNVTQANGGGIFSRDAIGLDTRRPLRIEPQRDASRGGGGYELNTTMIYGKSVWRDSFGYRLLGTVA